MLSSRLAFKSVYKVGILVGKEKFCNIVTQVHLVRATQTLAVGVQVGKSRSNFPRVVLHELLDGCAATGVGVPNLMKPLKKWEPSGSFVAN